eukprot:6197922-Amphidinium_carterae.1
MQIISALVLSTSGEENGKIMLRYIHADINMTWCSHQPETVSFKGRAPMLMSIQPMKSSPMPLLLTLRRRARKLNKIPWKKT